MDNLIIDLFKKNIIEYKDNTIIFSYNNLISYPYIINSLVKFIYDKIKFLEITNIIGINNISAHLSSILSYNHNIPLLQLNKNKLINGSYEDNNSVILINNGSSNINKYLSLLKSNKVNITYIFNIYTNRNIDNYNVLSLFEFNTIYKTLLSNNLINKYIELNNNYILLKTIRQLIIIKKSKLCYNCSLTNIKDIIREIDNIGKYVVMIKICSNNIDNFCSNYGQALHKLSQNHNFIIVDDVGIYNFNHINLTNYKWCNILTTYNCDIEYKKDLIYINNSNKVINSKVVGVIGNIINGNHLSISNKISNTDELKQLNINMYDIIQLDGKICSNKIINYINSF